MSDVLDSSTITHPLSLQTTVNDIQPFVEPQQRLAGESLMVPQDSTSVAAWTKAATEANEKTKETVMSNVIEGEAGVALTKKVLEGLKARRRGLESLRRDL